MAVSQEEVDDFYDDVGAASQSVAFTFTVLKLRNNKVVELSPIVVELYSLQNSSVFCQVHVSASQLTPRGEYLLRPNDK